MKPSGGAGGAYSEVPVLSSNPKMEGYVSTGSGLGQTWDPMDLFGWKKQLSPADLGENGILGTE